MFRRSTLILTFALLAACSGGGGGDDTDIDRSRTTTVEDDDGTDTVTLGEPIRAYEITYRVEERDGDDVTTHEATRLVERPFRSRFESGELVRVADFAYFAEREPGDETEVHTAVPTPAPGDVRADLLPLDRGHEVRRVAGRTCQVHELGAQLLLGHAIEGTGTESCVDADGLVLEEVVRRDGEVVTRWIAQTVDTSPTTSAADFAFDGVVVTSAEQGGGSLREVEPTSRSVGRFYELEVPPTGFTHRGRYAIVPPQDASPDDEESRARVIAGVVDVWVRGVDVLVLDQGGTLGRVAPFGTHPNGTSEDELSAQYRGIAESIPSASSNEVRVLLPPGRYVKLVGTLPMHDLVALVADLVAYDGDGLVYR